MRESVLRRARVRHSDLSLSCTLGLPGLGSRDPGQHLGRALGPDERLWIALWWAAYRSMATSSSGTLVKLSRRMHSSEMFGRSARPQPGGAGRSEVRDEARVLGQLGLHVGVGVGAVVFHDQVQVQVQAVGRLALNQAQELHPLFVTVLPPAHREA